MAIKNHDLKKKTILLVGVLSCAVAITALVFMKKQPQKNGISDGIITCGEDTSEQISNLFLRDQSKYLIELQGLDDHMDLDVIPVQNSTDSYMIRTSKIQCTVSLGDGTYSINGNKISDDDNYTAPVKVENGFYADADILFNLFGYTPVYETNMDHSVVHMTLQKQDEGSYGLLHIDEEEKEIESPRSQLEQAMVDQTLQLNQPGDSSLPTVPHPSQEPAEEESESESIEETLPAEVQEIIDNRPEQETKAPASIVDKPIENPNKKTEEEFDQQWNEVKSDLKQAYSQGTTPTGKAPYEERGDSMIAYNPMSGALYYDTISVSYEPSDGALMTATFANEWSDQAMNIDNEQTKKFYESIPQMVETTLKSMLGDNAGEELYQYIKENADRTTTGGYLVYHDERGNLATKWTDGQVGDGIQASEIDFEKWQDKHTDDGLRYYAARSGEGFMVKVFKN